MEAKTYRVKSISEALDKIREELGPDASVLHTRRIKQGLWNWLNGNRYEVVASNDVPVPDRFQQWMNESIDSVEELVQEELDLESLADNEVDPADAWKFQSAADGVDSFSDESTPQYATAKLVVKTEPNFLGRSFVSRSNESFEEFLGIDSAADTCNSSTPAGSAFEDSMQQRGNGNLYNLGFSQANEHRHGWEQLFA